MILGIKTSGVVNLGFLAAIIATICDGVHVYTKTLSYPDPWLFNQAWWVFPGFFTAFVGMTICYLMISSQLRPIINLRESSSFGSAQDLIENLTIFAIIYILSGFGNFEPLALSLIIYSTFILRWLFSYDRIWLLILAIILAIGGMAFEGLLAQFNQVTYRHSDIFNVPWWLGGVYMHGAFALRAGMRALVYNGYHH